MEQKELNYIIREARKEEWNDAMALAWRTFMKYEGEDYSQIGIKSFQRFITDSFLHKMFINGNYRLFLAMENQNMIGIITLRDSWHISLLFVDEKYHYKGVGKKVGS